MALEELEHDQASDRRDSFYLMDGLLKEVVEIQYGEVDLLPTGVLKSMLPITFSYGSNLTSRSLAMLS